MIRYQHFTDLGLKFNFYENKTGDRSGVTKYAGLKPGHPRFPESEIVAKNIKKGLRNAVAVFDLPLGEPLRK